MLLAGGQVAAILSTNASESSTESEGSIRVSKFVDHAVDQLFTSLLLPKDKQRLRLVCKLENLLNNLVVLYLLVSVDDKERLQLVKHLAQVESEPVSLVEVFNTLLVLGFKTSLAQDLCICQVPFKLHHQVNPSRVPRSV